MWLGDMPMKKTVVLEGLMFRSTHRAHVCITLLYATGLSTSMYFVDPLLNEPLLLRHQNHQQTKY
jgi:hypothetical protein